MPNIHLFLTKAKSSIQRGRDSINKVVAFHQGFRDILSPYNDRLENGIDSYNERIENWLESRGIDDDYEFREDDYEHIQEQQEQEGVTVEIYRTQLFETEESILGDQWGSDVNYAGYDILGYEAEAGAYAELGRDRLQLGVDGSAAAYIAQVEVGLGAGPLGANAEAMVGAQIEGNANLDFNPWEGDANLEMDAGIMIGAQAGAEGNMDIRYAEAGLGGDVYAGFGGGANLDVGFDDGVFEFGFGGELAFGLGAGFDTNFSVDVGQIISDGGAVAGWGMDRAGDAVGVVGGTAGWTVDKFGDGISAIGGIFG